MKIWKWEWRGLKISTFNALMIVLSCALYFCLLTATTYTTKNYEQLVRLTDDHIRLEDAARTVLRASDYLTEQVRMYVQTLDEEYAWHYFEEATIMKNREKALAVMQKHSFVPAKEKNLTLAVNDSDALMVRELYAIALVAAAEGHAETSALPVLANTMLEAADAALPRQEKIEKARSMVFDKEYQTMKNQIYDHLDDFTQGVLTTTKTQLGNGQNELHNAINTQRVLLSVLMVLNAVSFLVITVLVVRPLRDCIRSVRERAFLKVEGSYEFRYLARVYNDVYRRSDALAASEALLRSKVELDALTGIHNRHMFNEMCEVLRDGGVAIALMIIDVDKFKDVNDTYGHVAGDRALTRVATLLQDTLRATDYVFRIGGDEFAAILPEVTEENADSVRQKIADINESLLHPEEGEIPLSLSVGLALSDNGYRDELYVKADCALYWVKKHGRCNCSLYTDYMSGK